MSVEDDLRVLYLSCTVHNKVAQHVLARLERIERHLGIADTRAVDSAVFGVPETIRHITKETALGGRPFGTQGADEPENLSGEEDHLRQSRPRNGRVPGSA